MWKFCIAILSQEFRRSEWQPVMRVVRKLTWILDLLLGTGLVAGILALIYVYVPIASNKRWTAIVILAGLVLF